MREVQQAAAILKKHKDMLIQCSDCRIRVVAVASIAAVVVSQVDTLV